MRFRQAPCRSTKAEQDAAMTTPASRPVPMISRNYNPNPVSTFRSRSQRRMCFTFSKKFLAT
jgi:hypothetical protein